MTQSKCDRCGETAKDIDTGFSPGLHRMKHDCGGTWRVVRYTLIEFMPASHRASHLAAGNAGVWPHNGAERVYVEGVEQRQLDPRWAEVIEDGLRELPDGETALGEIPDDALPDIDADSEEVQRADYDLDREKDGEA